MIDNFDTIISELRFSPDAAPTITPRLECAWCDTNSVEPHGLLLKVNGFTPEELLKCSNTKTFADGSSKPVLALEKCTVAVLHFRWSTEFPEGKPPSTCDGANPIRIYQRQGKYYTYDTVSKIYRKQNNGKIRFRMIAIVMQWLPIHKNLRTPILITSSGLAACKISDLVSEYQQCMAVNAKQFWNQVLPRYAFWMPLIFQVEFDQLAGEQRFMPKVIDPCKYNSLTKEDLEKRFVGKELINGHFHRWFEEYRNYFDPRPEDFLLPGRSDNQDETNQDYDIPGDPEWDGNN